MPCIGALSVRIDGLERRFRQATATDDTARAALDIDAGKLQAALPAGSALLELRQFRPVDFETGDLGEPHLLALLLPSATDATAKPQLRDLGPWKDLAPQWQAAKARIRSTVTSGARGSTVFFGERPKTVGLYQALFGAWDQQLATYNDLFLAPDGRLQLTAFSALRLPDGRYWVERQQLHRVSTGRDLLRSAATGVQANAGLWAIGGVDYLAFPNPALLAGRQLAGNRLAGRDGTSPTPSLLLAGNARLRGERAGFKPLPGTGPEVRSVARDYRLTYSDAPHLLLGPAASEGALKALRAPRVLHLATHGFYLDTPQGETPRPLTQAGLALAGANLGLAGDYGPDGEDGILYALEVLGLDLQGTELVTLSACDTAQGELDSTEGVYGLARAFRVAGARQVLMTLWSLDDALAQAFMSAFYQDWLSQSRDQLGTRPGDALRRTQLAFINSGDPERRHPRHWAPYVLVESGLDAAAASAN